MTEQLHDLAIGGTVEQQQARTRVPEIMDPRRADRGSFEEAFERLVDAPRIDRSSGPAGKDQVWELIRERAPLADVDRAAAVSR